MATLINASESQIKKLRLEIQFRTVMVNYFNKIVNTFLMLGQNKLPLNVSQRFDDELKAILITQYLRVEKVFDHGGRDFLPRELQSTAEEDREINRALRSFNNLRSTLQTENMNRTTQRQIEESLAIARSVDTDIEKIEDGKVVRIKASQFVGFELFLGAGNVLKRKLASRVSSIVSTETQIPAEIAKLTEIEVLSGNVASVIAGTPTKIAIKKTWVSEADDLVRPTHLQADGQDRKANVAFTVGGFRLMVPGDTSLGAPKRETINCRCDAEYDNNDLIRARFKLLTA